jgi:hypothetical protein
LQLASDFGRIATALELQSPEETDGLESSIEVAKAWLSRASDAAHGGGTWLLIFDKPTTWTS